MNKRKIIKIDEKRCNGCGECMPNCPEGALQIIEGKARLISDLFCDGLGACIGHCPQGAITIEERTAETYDEKRVMENIIKQGEAVIIAHLEHLKDHNQQEYLKAAQDFLKQKGINVSLGVEKKTPCSCPGSKVMEFNKERKTVKGEHREGSLDSELKTWPVQLMLVPAVAPFLEGADLLIAADCVPFAYALFHQDLLKGKTLLVGCPKLDDARVYEEKLKQIFENRNIKSVTYAHMEVPCCFGLIGIIEDAIKASGKQIPFTEVVIGIKGERLK